MFRIVHKNRESFKVQQKKWGLFWVTVSLNPFVEEFSSLTLAQEQKSKLERLYKLRKMKWTPV